jgi:hypothetical protein
MSGQKSIAPWVLPCPWCDYRLVVSARGSHGRDQGSGYEAAKIMERHVSEWHGKTWAEFLGTPTEDA